MVRMWFVSLLWFFGTPIRMILLGVSLCFFFLISLCFLDGEIRLLTALYVVLDLQPEGNMMELEMGDSDNESGEDDNDEGASDEDEEEEDGEEDRLSSWGTRKRAYYNVGSDDEEDEEFEDSDEEAAVNEEAEVRRLQTLRAQGRSEADFADAFAVISKKAKNGNRSSASALAADLHEGIHADLQGLDQDGYVF